MCISDFACKDISQHYYKTSQNLQQKVKLSGKRVEKYMGKEMMVSTGVFILGATDKKIKARVTRNFSITYKSGDIQGDLKWEF
jgi:hypothetical protein